MLLKREQIKTFKFTDRVKDFDQFFNKIVRKKISEDYFNGIEDIAGVRVICHYLSDVERIGNLIEQTFTIVRIDRKATDKRLNEVGYLSDHYIVKLPEELKIATDNDIMDLKCEIQVRTILMHAWDTVSHELDYKKEIGIGNELELEMYALSGGLFVADLRFDAYRKAKAEELKNIENKTVAEINLQQDITPQNLEAYLKWRFPTRQASEIDAYQELAVELNKMNYESLETINRLIMKAQGVLLQYEKEYPPSSIPGTKFDHVGAARICITLADTQNKESDSFYVINLARFRQIINRSD